MASSLSFFIFTIAISAVHYPFHDKRGGLLKTRVGPRAHCRFPVLRIRGKLPRVLLGLFVRLRAQLGKLRGGLLFRLGQRRTALGLRRGLRRLRRRERSAFMRFALSSASLIVVIASKDIDTPPTEKDGCGKRHHPSGIYVINNTKTA